MVSKPEDPEILTFEKQFLENKLEEMFAAFSLRFKQEVQSEITGRLEGRVQMLEKRSDRRSTNGEEENSRNEGRGSSSAQTDRNEFQLRQIRLDLPDYDGEADPEVWLFKMKQKFNFHQVPEDYWYSLASMHLIGEAANWFISFSSSGDQLNFSDLEKNLRYRFSDNHLIDFQAQLLKLHQVGTVREYLKEFERLKNKVTGLSESILISTFVGGLREDLQWMVSSLEPQTLSVTITLAKKHEAHDLAHMKLVQSGFFKNHVKNWGERSYARMENTPRKIETNKVPVLRLSPQEEQRRRELQLCFKCDDKWQRGHVCKNKKVFLIQGFEVEEDARMEEIDVMNIQQEQLEFSELSIHALSGSIHLETIRVLGSVMGREINILIDPGSTHNFINLSLVKLMKIPVNSCKKLKVSVASGESIPCSGICQAVPVSVDSLLMQMDLFVVSLGENDIILGVQWLKPLGDVVLNFNQMTFRFCWKGNAITWKGVQQQADIQLIEAHQLTTELKSARQVAWVQINHIQGEEIEEGESEVETQEFLQEFSEVFKENLLMVPDIECKHKIKLNDPEVINAIKPYRYLHFLKLEMEKHIKEYLKQGPIRNSISALSSPVLLVKKSSGEWRLCVDYRHLNSNTVKDKFPMPRIDELLEELGGASWFSKIDLRSGFHQIQMHPDDVEKTTFSLTTAIKSF